MSRSPSGQRAVTPTPAAVLERSKDQGRYNEFGRRRLRELRENRRPASNPETYRWRPLVHDDLIAALGPTLRGRHVLELGCGVGEFSVFCAQRGATVTGVDIGPDLVAAAREWARINQVRCAFQQANVADLPFASSTYDVVVGLAVLHHLCPVDLKSAMREACRVLTDGGHAVFLEPVQHSTVMAHLRHALPVQVASKYGSYRKPSIWNRAEWTRYLESLDDRYLTFAELAEAAAPFADVRMHPRGLLDGLEGIVGTRCAAALTRTDAWLIRRFPAVANLCREVLVVCRKGSREARPTLAPP